MTDAEQNDLNALAAELQQAMADTPVDLDIDPEDSGLLVKEEPPSPTALKLDKWSLRRGRQWSNSKDGKKIMGDVDEDQRKFAAADFLSLAWDACPELADRCVDSRRHHFMATVMQTNEYQSLHRSTMMNDIASELAAASFAKQYVELVATEEPTDELERDCQAIKHAQEAMDEAKSEVDSYRDTCRSLGGDGSMGDQGMSAKQVRQMFDKIRSNHMLRRIMELAGRYRNLAQCMQQGKPCHGSDEVIGFENGADLSRVLCSEFARLNDEDLEYDFLRRFVDNSLTIRELQAKENESKGPLVIVVDESGSMSGDPICHAKAMALAILWIAEHQKRWACLVGFAGGTQGNYLTVEPGKRDMKALMEWLGHFFSGGTSLDVPCDQLPEKWDSLGCPEGRTDMIVLTDAYVNLPEEIEKSFMAWKQATQVRMNSIIISDEPGDLAKVSDRLWKIDELGLESAGVAECLSV